MIKKKKIKKSVLSIFIISVVFIIALTAGMLTVACSGSDTATRGESEAVSFTLQDLYGNEINIEDYRGMFVVLNFWATWCPPCRQEIPDFIEVYDDYKDKNVMFFGISNDFPDNLKQFAYEYEMNYPTLYDEGGSINRRFQVNAVPRTIILDREGYIAFDQVGMLSKNQLIEAIESVM